MKVKGMRFSRIYRISAVCAFALVQGCVFPGMDLDADHALEAGFTGVEIIRLDTKTALTPPPKSQADGSWRELIREGPEEYLIGTGDGLQINIWSGSDPNFFSGKDAGVAAFKWQVRNDGTIFLPYVGVLEVGGLTIEGARAKVSSALSQFFKSPQVDLQVVQYSSQSFSLLGEFNEPGARPISTVGVSLSDVITLARGLTTKASSRNMLLHRGGRQYEIPVAMSGDVLVGLGQVYLQNNDIVEAPTNQNERVFVLGEINQTSLAVSSLGMTLAQALSDAGGVPLNAASSKGVYVLRAMPPWHDGENISPADVTIYWLDARTPDSYLVAENFELIPNDVLYVSTYGPTRFSRIFREIFAPIQTLYQVDTLLGRRDR